MLLTEIERQPSFLFLLSSLLFPSRLSQHRFHGGQEITLLFFSSSLYPFSFPRAVCCVCIQGCSWLCTVYVHVSTCTHQATTLSIIPSISGHHIIRRGFQNIKTAVCGSKQQVVREVYTIPGRTSCRIYFRWYNSSPQPTSGFFNAQTLTSTVGHMILLMKETNTVVSRKRAHEQCTFCALTGGMGRYL